jgi:hypothetical protein
MIGKSKRGIETDKLQQDAQVVDYKSRTGGDEQFKLFNYQYRGIASTTPRTLQDPGVFRRFLDNSHVFSHQATPLSR